MATVNYPSQNVLQRLWIYQKERFPLFRTIVLLIVFSASSVTASAQLSGRPLPSIFAYFTAFILVFGFFWQLRAADEYKDLETDALYRPERPIPRGLVSLRLIIMLGLLSMLISIAVTYFYLPRLLILVCTVWAWMALMTAEFFAPKALHASPFLLLVSHMLIMPLIDVALTGCEWLPYGFTMPNGLWAFILLSLANGCIFEISRKIWAPENERVGVETYSSSWGIPVSILFLLGALLLSFAALIALSLYHHMVITYSVVGVIAALPFLYQIWAFYIQRTPAKQIALDKTSGLWILLCYLEAALLPFFKG